MSMFSHWDEDAPEDDYDGAGCLRHWGEDTPDDDYGTSLFRRYDEEENKKK